MRRTGAAAPRPGGLRPVRALGRVAGCLAGLAGWAAVAHFGGAGWVQALGDVLGAALLVGLVAPALACARCRVTITAVPADAAAGARCELAVTANRRVQARLLDPPGPARCIGPGAAHLEASPPRRGVHRQVLVEVSSAAPFGLLWWRRRVLAALPSELVVSPRLGPAIDWGATELDHAGEGLRRARSDVGEPWSVRGYRSGDQRRAVHWPATAHGGTLAVKEMVVPRAEPATVTVRLASDPDAAERLAERALGSVAALLHEGTAVALVTTEEGGRRAEAVHGVVEAGRRLARAVPDGAGAPGLVVRHGPAEWRVDGQDPSPAGDASPSGGKRRTSLLERVRRANAPGPPEDSRSLRVACTAAVLCGIAAVWSQGEISPATALVSGALLAVGMVVSYRLRRRPVVWSKLLLAVGALASFAWFFHSLAGQSTADVATVEDPLAVLFVAIQVLHAFDVPARRDLAFSLAGSAILMAVAAAQATDMGFAVFAVLWMAFAFRALTGMWASAAGLRRLPARVWGPALGATLLVALGALLLLPAPTVAGRINFPLNPGADLALAAPLGLAGDGVDASEPARAGTPAGRSRVGGFTGFSTRLDTALRGSLGSTVVMRVRAQLPSYWVGETFDRWDGQSWLASADEPKILQSGSPFVVPVTGGGGALGSSDLQTFYVVQSTPNLVFHADDAVNVWFPARSLFVHADGTIVSPIALGRGAVYTVRSYPNAASPAALAADGGFVPTAGLPAGQSRRYLQLPYAYPRAGALAAAVTAPAASTYGKVEALISWIGTHTRYSTSIPPLPPGADAVDTFLFTTRSGFCEQISSALTVMLRSLGIPAREAVGFVPGPYNPVTDLYDIQARDAHAWVQVWFPKFGWQSFDPTAVVPAANPRPGLTALHDAGHLLGAVPPLPVGGGLGLAAAGAVVAVRRRRRPATWPERVARRIERAGRRSGRPRQAHETLSEYAAALDARRPAGPAVPWGPLAALAESVAYGRAGEAAAEGRARTLVRRATHPGP